MPKSIRKNSKNKGKNGKIIYLDYAASATPNPSSIHELGVAARRKLERARRDVARVLHARPEEILWTSGGTEGNNLAIQGAVHAAREQGVALPHIVTTNIEHPSVLETCRLLERRKLAEVTVVPVEPSGIVDAKKIGKAIKKNSVLVTVMYANNEIGTVQPLKDIAREIRHYRKINDTGRPYFHTDAVQAAQYLPMNVERLGVDLLTLSGSKLPGAGRAGILYKKRSVPLGRVFGGGDQEGGLRPGTENVVEAARFAAALSRSERSKEKEAKRLTLLRDHFFGKLLSLGAAVNGDMAARLPNNVNVTFPGIPSDLLVIELSAKGIMCSSKSACKSSSDEGSYVIEAIRPGSDPEIGGLRFSLGAGTAKRDIDRAVAALTLIVAKLKKWYS